MAVRLHAIYELNKKEKRKKKRDREAVGIYDRVIIGDRSEDDNVQNCPEEPGVWTRILSNFCYIRWFLSMEIFASMPDSRHLQWFMVVPGVF